MNFKTRDEDSLSNEREFRLKMVDCVNFLQNEHKSLSYSVVKELKGIKVERNNNCTDSDKLIFKSSVVVEKPVEYLLSLAKDPTM